MTQGVPALRTENLLVLSAIGADRNGLVDALTKAIKEAGCNIVDSRMAVMGGEFAMLMLLSGTWDTVAKIENVFPRLERKLDLIIVSKRTAGRNTEDWIMPYAVEVVSVDKPGIVHELAHFFSSREIGIEDMYTSNYSAQRTSTPMFSLHMTIGVPANSSIAALRSEFMDFCDQLNLDAVMEPVK